MRVSWDYVRQNTTKKVPSTPLPEPKGDELPEAMQEEAENGENELNGGETRMTAKKELKSGKDTQGKSRLSLVPPGIIESVKKIKEDKKSE